jgi:hypothetical protein
MKRHALVLLASLGLAGTAQAADAGAHCKALAARLLDRLEAGDYTGAQADFSVPMQAASAGKGFGRGWQAMAERYGPPGRRDDGAAQLRQVPGFMLVETPQPFGHITVMTRVVCDGDGKVSGFWLHPLP